MIDWQPPAANETDRIRSAIERNRQRRNEAERKRTLERVREELSQGPLTAEEREWFRSSVARAYAEAEARRRPHPQEEMPL